MNRPGVAAFVATSLDGFIARLDGGIDWLIEANKLAPPGEDCGFAAFMASVDVLVMGRNSFELVRTFEPWPYAGKRVVVLSSRGPEVVAGAHEGVSWMSGTPAEVLDRLSHEGVRSVYVDGGVTIQGFLSAGLLDEITVTTVPVLIGTGLSLFGQNDSDLWLERVACTAYPFGFTQCRYRVRRPETG